MTHLIRRRACLVAFMAVVSVSAPAFAEITATPFWLPYWPSVRNAAAFDSVNQVYLVTQNGSPVTGQFLDKNGTPIGGAFAIASPAEGSFISWSQIAFGGPPSDPTFLVTYTAVVGSQHLKSGRLIRYRGGAAEVSAPSFIVNTNGQWQAAEKAQSVWFGDHFIAATRVVIGGIAQPVVQRFEMSGAVSAPVSLGDSLDFEGSATLACAPSGTCLATGFAGGYPFGNGGAVFARLFNANTLEPESGLFYLDDHTSRMDDPWVVYNAARGQFTTVWWQASYAQFRTVSTSGALGSYQHRFGDWAGDIALRYNAATGTTLLTTKWRNFALSESRWADLYAVEVDNDFRMTPVVIQTWDGKFPEFWTSVAADEVNGRWLTTSFETAGGRGALVVGTRGTGVARTAEDFDGNGTRDIVVYRPSNGVWYVRGLFAGQWGLPGDVPVPGDYNGDRVTDVAVWRPSTGEWYVHNQFVIRWGAPGDVPVPGDYNGDGLTDLAIWRPSTGQWWVRNQFTVQWGWAGDVPVPGDYNGDGVTDVAVRRPSTSTWWVLNQFGVQWGMPEDVAVPGDYNGDGTTDVAVWRPSNGTWHVLNQFGVQWGAQGDVPVQGDYNGDGATDVAVWRPSTGTWHVLHQFEVQWGWPDDVAVGPRR
jgi:hypothetical protein